MPLDTKTPDELVELINALPAHLRENFARADAQIQESYGVSPGIPALVRLWLACGTSWRIRREFENAVLEISGKTRTSTSDEFDGDDL